MILVYITHKNLEEAKKIISYLMEKKLIACANHFPITSVYWWKGKIENNDEIVSIIKTRDELWEPVREEVNKIHPYETPCIMKIGVEANKEYEEWVNSETKTL